MEKTFNCPHNISKQQEVFMPGALSEIPRGSMNPEKLVAYIIQIISRVKPVEDSVYDIAPKKIQSMSDMIDDFMVPLPPQCLNWGNWQVWIWLTRLKFLFPIGLLL